LHWHWHWLLHLLTLALPLPANHRLLVRVLIVIVVTWCSLASLSYRLFFHFVVVILFLNGCSCGLLLGSWCGYGLFRFFLHFFFLLLPLSLFLGSCWSLFGTKWFGLRSDFGCLVTFAHELFHFSLFLSIAMWFFDWRSRFSNR
jgi:hypothetical protein